MGWKVRSGELYALDRGGVGKEESTSDDPARDNERQQGIAEPRRRKPHVDGEPDQDFADRAEKEVPGGRDLHHGRHRHLADPSLRMAPGEVACVPITTFSWRLRERLQDAGRAGRCM